jgi:hypothetical protein
VRPAGISGGKKRKYLENKMNELATNNNKKAIRDMYKGTNELQARIIA